MKPRDLNQASQGIYLSARFLSKDLKIIKKKRLSSFFFDFHSIKKT